MANIDVNAQLDELIELFERDFKPGAYPTLSPTGSGVVQANFAENAVNSLLGAMFDPSNPAALAGLLADAFPGGAGAGAAAVPRTNTEGLIGTQAVLAAAAQAMNTYVIPRVQSLKPMIPCNSDCKGYETLIPVIISSLTSISESIAKPGTSYLYEVRETLNTLLGAKQEGSVQRDVACSVFQDFGERLGINKCSLPRSAEQEQILTDFKICVTFIGMFAQAVDDNTQDNYFGTQLQTIAEIFDHMNAQLNHLDRAVTSVEANALPLPGHDDVTIGNLFAMTRTLCRRQTIETLELSGWDGIEYQLRPSVLSLRKLYGDTLDGAPDDHVDCGIGKLLQHRGVRNPMQEISCDLERIEALTKAFQG